MIYDFSQGLIENKGARLKSLSVPSLATYNRQETSFKQREYWVKRVEDI
jgi:hypothetical protein